MFSRKLEKYRWYRVFCFLLKITTESQSLRQSHAIESCFESNFHILFLNNSAKIEPIQLKFGSVVIGIRRFFLKKELLNLVKRLLRYGSIKTTLGFLRRRHGLRPHKDISACVPHKELVLNQISTVSAEPRLF